MESRDWEIISKLHFLKNITKVANSLYISQPAITGRIKAIENELGTKIIIRSNKGISFTPIGEFVAEYANKQINSFNNFRSEIQDREQTLSGKITIMAPQIVVKYTLPRLVKEFTEMYPAVQLEITTVQSSEVVSHVKSGEVSFGFIRNELFSDNMERVLFDTDTISIISKSDFQLKDLPAMIRVDYITDSYYRNILHTWWEDNFQENSKIGMELSNLEACKEMVLNGVGYGLLPTMTIASKHNLYIKPVLDSNGLPIQRNTWLIYKNNGLQRRLFQTFLTYIKSKAIKK